MKLNKDSDKNGWYYIKEGKKNEFLSSKTSTEQSMFFKYSLQPYSYIPGIFIPGIAK